MHPPEDPHAEPLLRFNHQLLGQALALLAAHHGPGAPAYARPTGAHLRHVIEHYEALLAPRTAGVVDYDSRPRDTLLESCPTTAAARLLALQQRLAQWRGAALQCPVQVRGQGGVAGDFGYAVPSSIGRELAFVAGHAVHHFALLQALGRAQAPALGADFGKAPATVAHERAQATQAPQAPQAPSPARIHQETPCHAPASQPPFRPPFKPAPAH